MNRNGRMRVPKASLGFTLAEVAVAFIIISLLIAGAVMPLAAQIEARNISEARRLQEQIREALIGFALINGRLPCPALGSTASGSSGAGSEQVTGTACTSQIGVVPWATLGVQESDPWGRRFTYRVSAVHSDSLASTTNTTGQTTFVDCQTPSPTPTASFAMCSIGDIAVLTRVINTTSNPGAHETSALATGLVAVIVSHGRNGYGAWQSNGQQISGVASGTDESLNTTTGNTQGLPQSGYNYQSSLFYSRDQTPYASSCSETATNQVFCEFDDIVTFLTPNNLVSKMVSAGRLP